MRSVPRVHVVTSDRVVSRRGFTEVAKDIARSAAALQLRTRLWSGRDLQAMAETIARDVPNAHLYINDRVDVAVAAGTEGVHLPSTGLPPDLVRREFGDGIVIGQSVHSESEAQHAGDLGADYVFLGPIWQTTSHPDRPPLGPHALEVRSSARIVAIGGITPDRARVCREAGAHGVAVISAVWDETDPTSALPLLLGIFD